MNTIGFKLFFPNPYKASQLSKLYIRKKSDEGDINNSFSSSPLRSPLIDWRKLTCSVEHGTSHGWWFVVRNRGEHCASIVRIPDPDGISLWHRHSCSDDYVHASPLAAIESAACNLWDHCRHWSRNLCPPTASLVLAAAVKDLDVRCSICNMKVWWT